MQCRVTQVRIDKERSFTRLGHKNRQVGCDGALTIAGNSTRDQQGMQRLVYTREPDVGTQNAVALDVAVVPGWIEDILFFRRAHAPDCSQSRPAQQLGESLWSANARV